MIMGFIRIGAGRTPLFAEGLAGLDVTGCAVDTAVNEVDGADLTLPAENRPARSLLQKNAVIELRDEGGTVFVGSVASARQKETGMIRLEIDGALGWLGDICKAPFSIKPTDPNGPVENFLSAIISQYNAAVGTERVIHLGTVTVTGGVSMDHSGEYTSMLDLLREVREQLGGYYFMTYGSGIPTLHYAAAPADAARLVLELGRNVKTVENQLDFSDYASRIYATGHYYETVQRDGHDVRESRLITTSVTDATAEATFGRKDRTYRSDTDMGGDEDAGIPDKTQQEATAIIQAEAQAVLNLHKTPLRSLEMTAADLAAIGSGGRAFTVGIAARAYCAPLGIDEMMLVQKVRRDYINAANSVVTFGQAPRTLTRML